jgi:hypothetical protein
MKLSNGLTALLAQAALAAAALGLTTASVAALLGRGEERRQVQEVVNRYAEEMAPPAGPKADPKGDPQTNPAKGEPSKADRGKASTGPAGPGGPRGGDAQKPKTPLDEQVERIAKRHVFSPTPPKQKLSAKLVGVAGSLAFFAGSPDGFAVGGSFNGVKVLAIGPDWAEVEFEGSRQKLEVFAASPEGGPPGGAMAGPSGPPMPPGAQPAGGPPPGAVRAGGGAREMPPGFKLTPEMIEQFKKMPPEQQKQALDSMPEELREQLKKAL